jgi:hypothetical protein
MDKIKYDMLLLCNRPGVNTNADTISHHINALKRCSSFHAFELSMIGEISDALNLERFDVLGIHYTLHLSAKDNYYLGTKSMQRIAEFKGLKCVWLHDEYRNVNDVVEKLHRMKIDIIFTLASGAVKDVLYPKYKLPHARVETVFAGYAPLTEKNSMTAPLIGRDIDIGYRTRRPPFWLGQLGQEKINIGLGVKERAGNTQLVVDISVEEKDRVYGKKWDLFLRRCKTVLCVESGASILDFEGNVEKIVDDELLKNPQLTFADIYDRHLKEIDGKWLLNPVSPRVMEAAAAKTVMIGFEGKYSGIIFPWKHYIPLKKDFSNLNEVFAAIQNSSFLQEIANNTYNDLILTPGFSYADFAHQCNSIMCEEIHKRKTKIVNDLDRYNITEYKSTLNSSPYHLYYNFIGHYVQRLFLGTNLRKLVFGVWDRLPLLIQKRLRPFLKVLGK